METWEWIVIGAIVALVLVLALVLARVRRRRWRLKERFGPEYQRAVSDAGTGTAERRLREIESERDGLDVRPLPPAARERYLDEWRQAETRFVSDPRDAAHTADRLVLRALHERGYPDDEQRDRLVALVSVDHPAVADRYRHAHAMLDTVDGGEATENLRKAMLDLRTVLEDVLQESRPAA